jgi:hypothetical protein
LGAGVCAGIEPDRLFEQAVGYHLRGGLVIFDQSTERGNYIHGLAAPLSGVLVMLAFGLGTFPAMLMMGGVGQVLTPVWRQRGVWLAGSFIFVLGLITLSRGVLPFDAHVGHALATGFSG